MKRALLLVVLAVGAAQASDFGSGYFRAGGGVHGSFGGHAPPVGASTDLTVKSLSLTDTAADAAKMLSIDHYGSGDSQSYGLNIYNHADDATAPTSGTGARAALVVHQYSDLDSAVQVDNTRSQPIVTLRNARNDLLSTGTRGAGAFFRLEGFTASSPDAVVALGELTKDLHFSSFQADAPWTFISSTTAPSLQIIQPNAGRGLYLSQAGASNAIAIDQNGASTAVYLAVGTGAAGWYPLNIEAQDYGPRFQTSTDDGISLEVDKDGTGSGTAVKVTNKGTGHSISVNNASAEVWFMDASGGIRQKPLASPGTCSSTVEGLTVTVAGAAGALTKQCICTYDGTAALWVNLLNPSARSGSATSCPAS